MNVMKKGSTNRYSGYNGMNSNENNLEGGPLTVFIITVLEERLERELRR